MKVNRQSYSNCRSLPPNVGGELNGALTMQIDEVVWCNKSATDVIVNVQWWGEQESKTFRPLNSKPSAHRGLPTVFTYRIHTARQLFYSYLEDSRHLLLVVADARTYRRVGHATLSSLRESLTEQSAQQFCLPVVDGRGLKVAELYLSFSLKFFKNVSVSKTFPGDGDAAETFAVQKTVRSIQTRGVPDSLVVQLLEQARRLRDAMAKSALEDWEEAEVNQFCSECRHSTAPHAEKLLSCLLEDVEEETVQQEAVEALNDICPSAELLDLIASLGKPAEDGEPGSKVTAMPQEKCELPKDGKELKEVVEGSLMKSTPRGEHQVVADSSEFLKMVVSMRVCISSLYLQSIPRTNGTYFVDYEVPQGLVTGNAPLSRSTCSRRLAGRVVQFGQKFVHALSQQGAPLAASLRDACLQFRVYCRQLSERKRSLLGQASMSLTEIAGAERLEVQQDLLVCGVGKLRVVVQLGCDKAQYGQHVLIEEKERLQPGWTSSKDHLQPPAPTEKPSLQAVGEESGWQSVVTTQQDPASNTQQQQQQLLYALLRISYGRLETSCSSYIVCRAFWKDHVITSNVAWDSCNPRYDLHQVLPLLLSQKLLQRCHKNVLVLEVWKKTAGCIKHVPLGFAKLPLHPFYLAYKDPVMVSQLLRAKYPVVSVDGWVPVVCPGRGVCGELKVFLALGTEEQVRLLCVASWGSLGPGGDADDLSPELPGVNRGIQPLQMDTLGQGRTLPSVQREGGARRDTCQDSVPQNTAKTKDVRPPQNRKTEFLDIQGNPEGCRRHQSESRKSVNFNTYCQNEAWLGKVQSNNQSRGLCSCYCTRKYDEFPSVEVKLKETVSKLCDGLDTSEHVAAVRKDVGVRQCGKMAYVTSDESRERSVVHGAEDFNCDLGCLSGFSSDDDEPISFLRKEKELPVKDGAGIVKDQDTAPSGPERFLEDTQVFFSRLQRNFMKMNPAERDNLQMPSLPDFGGPGSMRDGVFEREYEKKAMQRPQRKGKTKALHIDTDKLPPGALRHLMEGNPTEADIVQMPMFFHLGEPSCMRDCMFESECQEEEMQHLQSMGNTEAGNSNADPHVSFLQGNLEKLNLAGGDASQMPNLLDHGEQDCMKDRMFESECEEGMQRLQRNGNREAEHSLKNYFSPGQFVGTGAANVNSYSGFTGEVTGKASCTDSVTVSCNAESKTASEEATVLMLDSTSVECAEAFSVRVKVEQAMQLKLIVPWHSDESKVYVTFLTNSSGLQQSVSPAGKASEGPVWAWSCDTQLAVDLLTNEEKRLVIKVWQMAGDAVNAAADAVLGFAIVDLTSLMHGSSFVSGWYSLVNYVGCCTGKIKVTVVPLEDLSKFFDHTPEAEKPFQDNLGLSESDLYSNLKDKLGELDEITARLRQRLGSVVSSHPTDASTQVERRESTADPASNGENMSQDKCIQTSTHDEDPNTWTDWLMGVGVRDLELENVFNPLLFQPILSSCVEQTGLRQTADLCGGQSATEQMAGSSVSTSQPQTVAERLQMLWSSSDVLVHRAPRQAPDGISIGGNSTSVSQLSVSEETKKTSKT